MIGRWMKDRPARFVPPWGLLGAIVLILAGDRFIESRSHIWLSPDQWIFQATGQRLTKNARDRELVIFGDSLAKLSIAPKEVERISGLKGYNFALAGSQAADSYFLLRRVLESGAKPKIVLVDFFPRLMSLTHQHNIDNDPLLLTPREMVEYAWQARDASFLTGLLVRRALPSVRQRQAIRSYALSGKRKRRNGFIANVTKMLMYNHVSNNGAQVHLAEKLPADLDFFAKDYFRPWELHPTNVAFVHRFFELAREHNLQVGLLLTPIFPEVEERVQRSGFEDRWRAEVQAWLDTYPNLFVIDGIKTEYQRSALMDPTHLAVDGLTTFSQDVGTLLAKRERGEATGRWLRVPKFHPAEETDRIEDLLETQAALKRLKSTEELAKKPAPESRTR